MTIKAYFQYHEYDATRFWNITNADIRAKGILTGTGVVSPVAGQLRIDVAPFKAQTYDGMTVTSDATETITVTDDEVYYLVLYAKYQLFGDPILTLQAITASAYAAHPEKEYLLIFTVATIPAGATQVLVSYLDGSLRDTLDIHGYFKWKEAVANFAALPTTDDERKDGDVRLTLDNHAAYVWNSGTTTWEPLASPVSIVNTWHDGSGISATTQEGAIEEIVSDLADDTGSGGSDKIGCGAITIGGPGLWDLSAGSAYDRIKSAYSTALFVWQWLWINAILNWDKIEDASTGGVGYDITGIIFDPDTNYNIVISDNNTNATSSFMSWGGWTLPLGLPAFGGNDLERANDIGYCTAGNRAIVVGKKLPPALGAGIQTGGLGDGGWWTERLPPFPFDGAGAELYGIWARSASAVAVGTDSLAAGNALYSTDSGVTWNLTAAMPAGVTTLRSVARNDENLTPAWVAVGDNAGAGVIFQTTDPSVAWVDTTPGGGIAQANSITYDKEYEAFIVVTDDEILYSIDDGLTWIDVSPDNASKNGIVAAETSGLGLWIAVSSGGTLYFSFNQGASWEVTRPMVDPASSNTGLSCIHDFGHMLRWEGGRLCRMSTSEHLYVAQHVYPLLSLP